ncbi:hypothetical protein CYLTODRAFT_426318 [Cylindrobasidium torrendii FP15055 ss-10]|uniref:Uncharacterized protein n=1 Tax=Cylindrobasidium torrendii FP15055 ss-10 TaxID=1314674 RepID=A0A0D7AXT7_9AGAR|nr:hypothetical protein CYLTODRAFT_426318 [Cylindrobasidium torrendii FP15055 ss-10]
MKQTLILSTLIVSASAIIVHTPVQAGPYKFLRAGGSATVSWTAEEGDPEFITLNMQNDRTLDTFQLAHSVATKDEAIVVHFDDDLPWSSHYAVDATKDNDVREVLGTSPMFTILGIPAVPTIFPFIDFSVEATDDSGRVGSSCFSHIGVLTMFAAFAVLLKVLKAIKRRKSTEMDVLQRADEEQILFDVNEISKDTRMVEV